MRKSGRRVAEFTPLQKEAVLDYLLSDKTYVEVSQCFNVNINNLKYWVKKYRKLTDENNRKELNEKT